MKINAELVALSLKNLFKTAKGEAIERKNCIITLEDAFGECCPSIYYGYSAEDCYKEITRASIEITDAFELAHLLDEFERQYQDRKSLFAGLDIVLYDYIARKLELPLYQYLGIPEPLGCETSYTISIDKPEKMENLLKPAAGFKAVKLKIGSEYDRENLARIRLAGDYKIRVDANGAYTYDEFAHIVPVLNEAEVELVEQPLKDASPENLRRIRKNLDAPIFLDESIIEVEDIYKYVNAIDGINIKLQRIGGIRVALKMIQVARSLDMKIMLGCMLETSIGNSATAHLAGFADFLDLDSSFLLRDDPFEGIVIDAGQITIPDRPGIGVMRRPDA